MAIKGKRYGPANQDVEVVVENRIVITKINGKLFEERKVEKYGRNTRRNVGEEIVSETKGGRKKIDEVCWDYGIRPDDQGEDYEKKLIPLLKAGK